MTPPAAMLQAHGGALDVDSGQAHLTGCIITQFSRFWHRRAPRPS